VGSWTPQNHQTNAIVPTGNLSMVTARQLQPGTQHLANDMFARMWNEIVDGDQTPANFVTKTVPVTLTTINTLLGTRDLNASVNSIMLRGTHAETNLGALSVVATQTGVPTILAKPITSQTSPVIMTQNAAGSVNLFYVDVTGAVFSAVGFTGDLTGNATGVKGVTAHNLLIGAGAGAMSSLAPGTAGYVLTSQGASLDPTWSAPTGTGGGSTPATLTTGGTGDAALIDLTTPLVQNIVNAISVSGGSSLLIAASAANKVGISVGGRWRTNTANVTTNSASGAAGNRYLIADLSGAVSGGNGIAFTLSTSTTLSNQYQMLIAAVRWDGTTLQYDPATTDFTNIFPMMNSTGWQPAVLAQDFTAAALTGTGFQNLTNAVTTTLYFPTAVRGMIWWTFALAQGAAVQDGYLYLSVDGGIVGQNTQFNGVPANKTLTLAGQARVSLGAGAHTFVMQANCATAGPTVGVVSVNGLFYR
jgi:hypothetical protein